MAGGGGALSYGVVTVLELRDFVLADDLRLTAHPGLNVLTGETGAGKSLLVDAMGLLSGWRADASWIRTGAERAWVQAEFSGNASCIVSRAVVSEGRNVARIDGEVVTVSELADQVGARIAVYAQNAHQALASASSQMDMLDRLLDDDGVVQRTRYHDAWTRRSRLSAERDALQTRLRDRARLADLHAMQIADIDAVGPALGEEIDLRRDVGRMRHADRTVRALTTAVARLDGDGGASEALGEALKELRRASEHDDRLSTLVDEVDAAAAAASAVAAELERFVDGYADDASRVDEVESRLHALERLFAKYGDGSEAVLAFREGLRLESASADEDADRLAALARAVDDASSDVERLAVELRAARRRAAERLERETAPILDRMAMKGARIHVAIDATDPGPRGADKVRFDVAPNEGEAPSPLASTASGGERSRLMLALWWSAGHAASTLVFDEVDAGVGGAAANAVGELLQELSRRHQVFVVTHLAQVAAHADRHFVVEKRTERGRTVSTVRAVDADAKTRELARMLTGDDDDAAVAAASALLAKADQARTRSSSPPRSASTSLASE